MIINSPLNWQVHYDYARAGLGQDATDPLTNISTGFSTMSSGWGLGEWGIVLIGGYALLSMFLTTRRGLRRVRRRRTQTRRGSAPQAGRV